MHVFLLVSLALSLWILYAQLNKDTRHPLESATPYKELIGRLVYLTITKLDITYDVHRLNQFLQAPTDVHIHATHMILKYLKRDPWLGLLYFVDYELCLNAFVDAYWTSCPNSRRSTSGFILVYLGTSLICWKSKKQQVVSRSSTEVEY